MYKIKISKHIKNKIDILLYKEGLHISQLLEDAEKEKLKHRWEQFYSPDAEISKAYRRYNEEFERVRKELYPEWHFICGGGTVMYRIHKWKGGKYATRKEAEERINQLREDRRWAYNLAEGCFGSAE